MTVSSPPEIYLGGCHRSGIRQSANLPVAPWITLRQADIKPEPAVMTNRIAVYLGLAILAAITAVYVLSGTENFLFLAKKFLELLEWVAFWR
ncbi:hypothetical protein [Marinovum algicola]|uniref:hypothetical protein n=1 Tax=Marinovum algicola TaxID=42444 RepID=UPI0024B9AC3B|nr:hypothetical protein [Marinovum algicola]